MAISGGVDSMALAALCADLKCHIPAAQAHQFEFTAFIVDHKARDESTTETVATQRELRRMGTGHHLNFVRNDLTRKVYTHTFYR